MGIESVKWECTCGEIMQRRPYVHKEQVGSFEVTLGEEEVMTCPKCGAVSVSLDELEGYQRRFAAAILRKGEGITGEVMHYARKAMGMTRDELARRLGYANGLTIRDLEENTDMFIGFDLLAMVALLEESLSNHLRDRIRIERKGA